MAQNTVYRVSAPATLEQEETWKYGAPLTQEQRDRAARDYEAYKRRMEHERRRQAEIAAWRRQQYLEMGMRQEQAMLRSLNPLTTAATLTPAGLYTTLAGEAVKAGQHMRETGELDPAFFVMAAMAAGSRGKVKPGQGVVGRGAAGRVSAKGSVPPRKGGVQMEFNFEEPSARVSAPARVGEGGQLEFDFGKTPVKGGVVPDPRTAALDKLDVATGRLSEQLGSERFVRGHVEWTREMFAEAKARARQSAGRVYLSDGRESIGRRIAVAQNRGLISEKTARKLLTEGPKDLNDPVVRHIFADRSPNSFTLPVYTLEDVAPRAARETTGIDLSGGPDTWFSAAAKTAPSANPKVPFSELPLGDKFKTVGSGAVKVVKWGTVPAVGTLAGVAAVRKKGEDEHAAVEATTDKERQDAMMASGFDELYKSYSAPEMTARALADADSYMAYLGGVAKAYGEAYAKTASSGNYGDVRARVEEDVSKLLQGLVEADHGDGRTVYSHVKSLRARGMRNPLDALGPAMDMFDYELGVRDKDMGTGGAR